MNEVERILAAVASGRSPSSEDKHFLDVAHRQTVTAGTASPTERGWLMEFVLERHGGSVTGILQDLFIARMQHESGAIDGLGDLERDIEYQILKLEKKKGVVGIDEVEEVQLHSFRHQLGEVPARVLVHRRTLETFKVMLVIVTRLHQPGLILDQPDHVVSQLLSRMVAGEPLNDHDRKVLVAYCKKHFNDVRQPLETKAGISMLTFRPIENRGGAPGQA